MSSKRTLAIVGGLVLIVIIFVVWTFNSLVKTDQATQAQ